jgi:hypothetical protein
VSDKFLVRVSCPACCELAATTIYKCDLRSPPIGPFLRDYYHRPPPDGTYQLECCQRCGLVFQRFVGDDGLLTALYSEWLTHAASDEPSYAADLRHFRESRDGHELMALAAFLERPRLKVLDYGTGWGLWPAIAVKLGHDAFATELASEKSAWVRERGVAMLGDDELSSHRFDVINLEQTLEHVSEPRDLLHSLLPSLGGVLKIAVPNASNANRIVHRLERGDCSTIGPVHPLEHINGFTPRSLDMLARSLGLKEVRPSLAQRFAFVRGGLPSSPKRLVKEVVRPFWTFRSPTNLYRWFLTR